MSYEHFFAQGIEESELIVRVDSQSSKKILIPNS